MTRGTRILCSLFGALAALGAAAAQAGQPYRIGGGDSLQVNVWKNPDLSQTVTVRPDGMITLPLIRDVVAAGLTAIELGKSIESKLSALVNAPNVTVTVTAASNYRVYSYGAVANGMFQLAAPIDALQLLARAGGPAPQADLATAFILRGGKRMAVDLRPRSGGAPEAELYPELMPEDVLVIPFQEATRRVLVAGEVRAPVSLQYHEGMTVLDAFVAAGGGTEFADLDSVRISRAGPGQRQVEIEVDLSKALGKGGLGKNVPVLPGDVVVVPR